MDAFNKVLLATFTGYKVERVVVDSFLGLLLGLVSGVGSVCWEVATFWVKVKLTK
jgi:hypothetical protein